MITIYGIKSCDSVRKARKLLNSLDIDYIFQDFREESVNESDIRDWLNLGLSIDELFNKRSTTYRTLKLKDLELTDDDKIKWLYKENTLIKRPVIINNNKIIVGYNESNIKNLTK